MPRKKIVDVQELQKKATDYAKGKLTTVSFNIGGLEEEDFGKAMNVILQQLVLAYAAGYAEGVK